METLEFSLSEILKKWLHMADWDRLKCGVFVEAFVSKVLEPRLPVVKKLSFFSLMQMISLHAVSCGIS